MPDIDFVTSTGDACIDALLSGSKWETNSLTFSFPSSSSYYGRYYGYGEPTDAFETLNSVQKATARIALKQYASVANLYFKEVTETSSTHAVLRFAKSDAPSTAWAYYPSIADHGGDLWFNNSDGDYDAPRKGNYAYATFLHELGHALGLKHAHEDGAMPYARDSMEYTVMTYRSHVGASSVSGYTNETWGFAQSLMMYDIAALQHMYGARYSTNSGNTTYSWNPKTGEMYISGKGQGAPGGNQIFLTIWDGGGTDTYDLSKYTTAVQVDLRPGQWTKTASEQLAKLNLSGTKKAIGNIANALLFNGDPRSLIENAKGGSGSDIIKGNTARNSLFGNAGNDKLYGYSGNDILNGGLGKDALYGGWGTDCVSYSDAKSAVSIDLMRSSKNGGAALGDTIYEVEGVIGSAYSDTIRGNGGNNIIKGGAGNDKIYARGGNDVLDGGAGNDMLYGNAGQDTMTGGSGSDVFVFAETGITEIDTIRDFSSRYDRIDLRAIDADTGTAGDQAFTYIFMTDFSGKAGELRCLEGVVLGDVNGDSIADFQIAVFGYTTLAKSAFYL
ncbi:M10 family metallopeptidase [Microvirga solisilvae]|uniref:M10 family metallopeptidase n=1 Tax=Microvirga solisilvae TaxID=2919498 RepID=UPI001FAED4FD|nr:M10 family metallopeptidase [Microvirga solisilvae]